MIMAKGRVIKSVVAFVLVSFLSFAPVNVTFAIPSCVGCGTGGTPVPSESPSTKVNRKVDSFIVRFSPNQGELTKDEKIKLRRNFRYIQNTLDSASGVQIRINSWIAPRNPESKTLSQLRIMEISKFLDSRTFEYKLITRTYKLQMVNTSRLNKIKIVVFVS